MKKEFSQDELSTLFPGTKVDLKGGLSVTITPIALPHLPKVLSAFTTIMYKIKAGMDPIALASDALAEALEILPYCIDVPVTSIPAEFASEVLTAMVQVNFTPELASKWTALAKEIEAMAGLGQGVKEKK